jgi:large subunit ribosomal protein L13
MRTHSVKASEVRKDWYVVDAEGEVLGRLATRVATVLRGKHKPIFTPHLDTGDHVIVVNAAKVRLTGRKPEEKRYFSHSMYPGGLRWRSIGEVQSAHPERVIMSAVRGMLPKNRLGRALIKKLKVYEGAEHPHEAQTPKPLPKPTK